MVLTELAKALRPVHGVAVLTTVIVHVAVMVLPVVVFITGPVGPP